MKYLLLYNPVSGKGKFKKKVPFIKKYFAKRNLHLDIYESKAPKDLEKKAFELSSMYDVFLVSGGDGTINEVINGVMKSSTRPSIAVLPSGTANDIAAILGMNKRVKRTLKIVLNNEPIKMDINQLNNRYFVYTTAAGIITKISYDIPRAKVKKLGYLAYVTEGAKDLLNDYQIPMEITHDNGVIKGEYMLALALSSTRVGGMFLTSFSDPCLNDGLLEIRLMKYKRHFKLFKLFKFFFSRGKKNNEDVHIRSSYYKIKVGQNVVWNTDGEKACQGSVEINVYKEALNVFVSDKSRKKFFRKQIIDK